MSSSQHRARHVAIIMDGNGRWAKKRRLPRALGHQRGVEAVRTLVRAVKEMGLECLTLYAFSSENWKRPEEEVSDLMNLMRKFIKSDLPEFVANDVRLKIIGDYKALAPDIVEMLEDALAQTAKGRHTLAVALNYGGHQEICRAASLAMREKAGADTGAHNGTKTGHNDVEIAPGDIERHLFTADLPPLDLLIRTSGEVRLSNFLLWQVAYAEMIFVDTLWPDFTPDHLSSALEEFDRRERRYGGR
ncbi:di-trans,poly-cis-decaprenylcistransferase [Altererythrobacter aurantiacus]|uniref:Isoprenyl transferase n=1 Tax=Parapontixanthobacter aurantiacus TaxID=1463599 RepID=A0A844ZCS0_9SPHN|nr:polyprenyl diphosphate synthase [Parapontixanthobacter aurantiacus]MXO84966.1 di-trans,poly-cis-decaprenylcistransferase [Parapontixanthobacter aurantiacus]